jgi:hypothetical protein
MIPRDLRARNHRGVADHKSTERGSDDRLAEARSRNDQAAEISADRVTLCNDQGRRVIPHRDYPIPAKLAGSVRRHFGGWSDDDLPDHVRMDRADIRVLAW